LLAATRKAEDHDRQSSPHETYYVDYVDYTDYAHQSISQDCSHAHIPASLKSDAASHLSATTEDLLFQQHDVQVTQDERVDDAHVVINRNQRNHFDLACSQIEQKAGNNTQYLNNESAGKARASPCAHDKKHCPHHPHARWVRYDPSGQAWCDKMDCWDCYRLMKIGEALDYRPLSNYTGGIVTIGQGREAWSSFVTSQGSFAVLTATQYVIELCKRLRLEVPDLSGEVKRLVKAGEKTIDVLPTATEVHRLHIL
jgi:hypothetical protein